MSNQNQSSQDAKKKDEEISDETLKTVSGGVRPPSGDSNPSDLSNRTVDTSDIIDPQAKP